ncbi:putative glycophosphotransferase [Cavenderia fasciculata]|uniref:Glycophosphotransferase n=1 Tax=Cavenderia fasciculata TaxID=261658 RepID=F4PYY4_CACFS|nr:putative glycophosphotransferase [Cavenderia fasciculata]EGG19013.1 putative glycophosphotransferase [Cavenderia fasciculata]|eukprot:XP_004366646.1 putative glycophosphotransferase [Cavenderia fasciculata]
MNKLTFIFLLISLVWLASILVYLTRNQGGEGATGGGPTTSPATLPTKEVFHCEHIDAVYTWVNGSDPIHIEKRTQRSGNSRYSQPGNNRFRDLMGLKYSLRSLKKYAPWIRRVHVVADDQYPSWFDTNNDEINFIFHRDYFPNVEDVPTFNSNGIEANFFNLPDDQVADCFIYFNDDIFVGSPIEPKDFWDPVYGQAIYKSSWTAPQSKEKQQNIWHASVAYTNELLNREWEVDNSNRHYASHGANFFNKKIFKDMQQLLPEEFKATARHPFRTAQDVQVPFLYLQMVQRYYATFTPRAINHYALIQDDLSKMKVEYKKILDRRPKTVCLNDGLSVDNPNQEVIDELYIMFETFFPEKPSWEL